MGRLRKRIVGKDVPWNKEFLTLDDVFKMFPQTRSMNRLLIAHRDKPDEHYIDPLGEKTYHGQYNVYPVSSNDFVYCYVCPFCQMFHIRPRGQAIRDEHNVYHEYFPLQCFKPEDDPDFYKKDEDTGEYRNYIHIIDKKGIHVRDITERPKRFWFCSSRFDADKKFENDIW